MKLGTVVLCAWAMTALPSLADEGASPEARAFLKEWASAMAEVRSLRVRFTQTKSLADQLGDSETWRHFNRRQHYRVHPRMSHCRRCTVRLQWRGHDAEHVIHDISAGGLSIRIANNNQVEVPPDRPIKAFLELPHSDEILEFTLRFVHEIDAVSHRRVGFAVDTIRTPFAAQVEDQLVAAVMEWQRTAIQVASNNPLPNTKSNG